MGTLDDWGRRPGSAVDIVVHDAEGVLVHVLGLVMAFPRDLVIIDADAARRRAAGIHALNEGILVVDFEVLALRAHVAEKFEVRARGRDARVSVEGGAADGVVGKGPAVQAAAAPSMARGTASALGLGCGGCYEGFPWVATAGSAYVVGVKAGGLCCADGSSAAAGSSATGRGRIYDRLLAPRATCRAARKGIWVCSRTCLATGATCRAACKGIWVGSRACLAACLAT